MAEGTQDRQRLTRVKIEGFRSIRSAEVHLGDVTVLVGANGSGKSNFIGFLQMVGAIMRERLQQFVSDSRGASSLLFFGADVTRVMRAELTVVKGRATSRYSFALTAEPGGRMSFSSEGFANEPAGSVDHVFSLGTGWTGPESSLGFGAPSSEDDPARKSRQFFESPLAQVRAHHFHNTSSLSSIRDFQSLRDDQFLHSDGGNLAVMLYRMQREHPIHSRRVAEELRNIAPEFHDFVLAPDSQRGGEQIELRWATKYSESIMGPNQLSDGSIRAIALLTLLLQPDEWKPPIVVIDEPELGLHPYAVGQIGRLISEAAVTRQIIVSTQSPHLVSQFEPEQVVVVENVDGASEFKHLSSEDLASWLEAFDNDLGKLFEMNVTGGAPVG